MHQILATVVGAVLGGIGFIARRFLERDPIATLIDRRLRLVSLHQRMKAAGLSESDLIQLERGLAADKSTGELQETPEIQPTRCRIRTFVETYPIRSNCSSEQNKGF